MDMPIPTPSPYSDGSEGSVLRDFVNESIAQERVTPSPRSELLSQDLHPARDDTGDPGPSKRIERSHKRQKPRRELVNSDTSPDDLFRLLIDQKQETHTLQKALHIAAQRVDSEAQRVLALERTHSQTAEHFRILNESRIAAQQEAMKANSELRLYQFQFENAQKEIARAQELLKMTEDQRDEAEEAAVHARAKARKYLQERMVAAAKEEGRRLGFEDGLRRAQEEQAYRAARRQTRARRNPTTTRRRVELNDEEQNKEPATNDDIPGDAEDQISQISSPTIHHAVRGRRAHASPEVIRVAQPPESEHSQNRSRLVPESEARPQESLPPPELVPVVQPVPDASRPTTPSVQIYSLDIPPAAELERQHSVNQYPGRHPQPWVTAQQYGEMTGQHVTPRHSLQSNGANVDLQRGSVTPAQPAPQQNPGKRKESWYRTLSRRLGRKRKPQNEGPVTPVGPPAQPTSWYTPAHQSDHPPVHVRDFGRAQPQSSADAASISTRMSQLDIVSPPGQTPNGSERSFGGGFIARTKFRDKDGSLSVINEDPASRTTTPFKGDVPRGTQNMEQQAPLPSQRAPTDASSGYSNPKVVDEWRRSTASASREMSSNVKPPSGPRRPAHLTVPAPLSPENAWVPDAPRSRTMSDNTLNGFAAQEHFQGLDHTVTSPEPSPIGITVEPPSRSPTEGLRTGGPERIFLSSTSIPTPSIHSAPSIPAMPSRPPPQNNYQSSPRGSPAPMAPQQQMRSRPGSVASHAPSQSYPMRPTPSKSPAYAPQPLPSDRPPSQFPDNRSQRNSVSRVTPKPLNQPLYPMGNGGDNISTHSDRHSASRNTPRQNYRNLPSTNDTWGGTARSDVSHRRVVSDTHLMPGPSHAGLPSLDGDHTLHRVGSNLSMRSADSKYAKYDESQYLDPAFFPPDSAGVGVDKGKGVDRHSPRPGQRPSSAASSKLSYVTDPLLKAN